MFYDTFQLFTIERILHHQCTNGCFSVLFGKTLAVGNIGKVHKDAFKRQFATVELAPELRTKFCHRVPVLLAVVDNDSLRRVPAEIGRALVHHDLEYIAVDLREHVLLAVGLMFKKNTHEDFGTVLETRLEGKVRLAPLLHIAVVTGNEFKGLHID